MEVVLVNETINYYPFGFIFTDFIIDTPPNDFVHKNILNKFNYYYEKKSSYELFQKDDTFILIHGHFVFLDQDIKGNLLECLLDKYTNNYNHFLDMLDLLAGRYVIFIHDGCNTLIFPDSTASRTTYYSTHSNIASSHVNLLNDIVPHSLKEYSDEIELLRITWDLSPFEDVKSITPNIYIDFNKKSKKRFFPRKKNNYSNYSLNEKFNFVEKSMDTIFKYYTEHFTDVTLSLTGGEDSRFTLAVAKSFHSKLNSFTYTIKENTQFQNKLFVDITSLDKKIVEELLNYVPIKHQFINFQPNEFHLSNLMNDVLNKNRLVEHLPFLAPYYAKLFTQREKTINIRSSIFGLARAHYDTMNRKNIVDEVKKSLYYSMDKYKEHPMFNELDLEELFNYGIVELEYELDFYDFHILDIYFWESRIGRWMPETLNETDLFFETLNVFNARSLIELSLSFSYNDRKSGFLFNELINRNYPILNFFGKNSENNLYEQMRSSIYKYSNTFNYFILHTETENNNRILNNGSNTLYMPMDHSKPDVFSEVKYIFSKETGYVKLELLSRYKNLKAEGYFIYEILLNDKLILKEDISQWNQPNMIYIYNLCENDTIKIKVVSKRAANTYSWERASRLEILNFEEVDTPSVSPKLVTCTSPCSIIFDNSSV